MASLLLDVAHRRPTQGHGQVAVDDVDGDPGAYRLLRIHIEAPIVVGLPQQVIHIHQARSLGEDLGHITGKLAPNLRGGAMDLRHHRLEHRWSRRHLDYGDLGARTLDQFGQGLTGLHGQLMAGTLALLLVQELDLQLTLPGVGTQIVMPHHTVEVKGPRRAGVELDGGDLRLQAPQLLGHAMGQIGGYRQGRALRHIDHHRVLRFVVQGQHLDRYPLKVEKAQR